MEAGLHRLLGYEVGAPTAVIQAHGEVNFALQHLALEDQLDGLTLVLRRGPEGHRVALNLAVFDLAGLSFHDEGAGQGVAAGFQVEGEVVGFAARVDRSLPLARGIGAVQQRGQHQQQSRQSGYALHAAYCIIADRAMMSKCRVLPPPLWINPPSIRWTWSGNMCCRTTPAMRWSWPAEKAATFTIRKAAPTWISSPASA